MFNHYIRYFSLAFGLLVWCACEDYDEINADDIEVPYGYALSAGTSTIFSTSSFAYDSEADWVTGSTRP